MCSSLSLDRLLEALACIPRGMGREAVSSSGFQGWGRGVERRLLQTPAPRHTACWEEGGGERAESPLSLGGHEPCPREGEYGEEEEGEGITLKGLI